MKQPTIRQPLPPEEIARRQRWVAVGATILSALLIVTWLIGLPGRLAGVAPERSLGEIFGKKIDASYIDVEQVMDPEAEKRRVEEIITSIMGTSTPGAAPTTTPETQNQNVK